MAPSYLWPGLTQGPVTTGIRGLSRSFCNRAASATVKACARHIGAAREREKVYSCSGIANSTRADFAKRRREVDLEARRVLLHPGFTD